MTGSRGISMSETTCCFCGKREGEVRQLLAGPPTLFICDECVELATDIIAEVDKAEVLVNQGPPPWDPSEDELKELERIGREIGEGERWWMPVIVQVPGRAGGIEGKLTVSEARPVAGRVVDPKRETRELTPACSFCGKGQHQVAKLIAGPSVYICNECVRRCAEVMLRRHTW